MIKTIYMDITGLINFNGVTGIQRVVIETTIRLISIEKANKDYEVVLLKHVKDCTFVICDKNKFFDYFTLGLGNKNHLAITTQIGINNLNSNAFWLDVDGVWISQIARNVLYSLLKKRNIKIGVYVHDLIAFTHPQFVSDSSIIRFPHYMKAVYDYADVIFTNTNSTLNAIKKLQNDSGYIRKIQYQIAIPGSDVTITNKGKNGSMNDNTIINKIISNGKYILAVSTIEVRKNYTVILDAFDFKLRDLGYQLVFVGKEGWKVDELMERVNNHSENGKMFYHLKNASDYDLECLYKNAKFLVFASFTEGFGLATVEALKQYIPTILSDVPVMREVGGEFCDYFDPNSPSELINIIEKYEDDDNLYKTKKEQLLSFKPHTWDECMDNILKVVLQGEEDVQLVTHLEQIVYISARIQDIYDTLLYVEKLMPFIKRVLVFCPEELKYKLLDLYQGSLQVTCITDEELLKNNELPDDHAYRNFFLRCLAMERDEVDEVFIMSDDDYRPLYEIEETVFINNNKYQGYYCYDLHEWLEIVIEPTSYDYAMYRTNKFLLDNGYPNLQYSSHQPQVISKNIFLEMLDKHKGIEHKGLCDWSAYFNYAIFHYSELFDIKPYITLAWPGYKTDWPMTICPSEYKFENYYSNLYEANNIFGDVSCDINDYSLISTKKKVSLWINEVKKNQSYRANYRLFENKYNVLYKVFPDFILGYSEDGNHRMLSLPKEMLLKPDNVFNIPMQVLRIDSDGSMMEMDKDIEITYSINDHDNLNNNIKFYNWCDKGYLNMRIIVSKYNPGKFISFFIKESKEYKCIATIPLAIDI